MGSLYARSSLGNLADGQYLKISNQGIPLAGSRNNTRKRDRFDNLKTIVLSLMPQTIDFQDLAFLGGSSDGELLIELDVANESYEAEDAEEVDAAVED